MFGVFSQDGHQNLRLLRCPITKLPTKYRFLQVDDPTSFYGREVPGFTMSAEAKEFAKKSEELNRMMGDQRSPLSLRQSGVTPNEAESEKVGWCRSEESQKESDSLIRQSPDQLINNQLQSSYRSWKSWKVLEFQKIIFQACIVL